MRLILRLLPIIFCSLSLNASTPLPPSIKLKIKKFAAENKGQMSLSERLYLASIIYKDGGSNILIFGAGKDSDLWCEINSNGKTVFLEDSQKWINFAQKKNPSIKIHKVEYNTKRARWKKYLQKNNCTKLKMNLPHSVLSTKWDAILIDAPCGYSDKTPGRMMSIYTTYLFTLNQNNMHVFIHDCNRKVEREYCNTFFTPRIKPKVVSELWHYHFQ